MGSELKPCPFCGGEVRIVHNEPYTLGAIVCDTCKALVMFPWYKTESQLDLKEEWDKRAEPEMQALPVHTMPRYIDAINFGSRLRAVAERSLQKDYNQFLMEETKSETAGLLRAIEILNSQHTADVQEVKHGHWDDSLDGITPICTVCGKTHKCFNRTPEFCPNCGAVMDERSDEA